MKIYFEYRYENGLQQLINNAAAVRGWSVGELTVRALIKTRREWRRGRWLPEQVSCFLQRENKRDKLTVGVLLSPKLHRMVYKMAVALGCSMAELLRRALEMYTGLACGEYIRPELVPEDPGRKLVRIVGFNVLDFPDHATEHLGGKLQFEIVLIT